MFSMGVVINIHLIIVMIAVRTFSFPQGHVIQESAAKFTQASCNPAPLTLEDKAGWFRK